MTREEKQKAIYVLNNSAPVFPLKKSEEYKYNDYVQSINQVIDWLEQEPRKGHWIEHPHEWGDNWQYSQYECNCCHNWAHFDTDYCPNCGAEMESEDWE